MKIGLTLLFMERKATIRKQLEVGSERARPNFTDDEEGRLLGSGDNSQEFAPAR